MSVDTAVTEVSLLDLKAQYDSIKEEIKEEIDRVLESQYFIMGPEVESFERKVADYCNTKHAIGCASGSDALLLSLMAIDVGPGDFVLTTPFTFFATAGAVARLGATPVFLDIDPFTFNLDASEVRKCMSGDHPVNKKMGVLPQDVKAIIPVHLYGQMSDMDPLMEIAEQYNIKVIEDAAQAIGAEYKERRAGSIGDFGCFSFFPSKNLGGYGDGGLITTNDDKLAEKIRTLRTHGAKPKYHHSMVGLNSRLDALQAAVLNVKIGYLDKWSDASRERAITYNHLFEQAGLKGNVDSFSALGTCSTKGSEDYLLKGHQDIVLCPEEVEGDPEKGGRHVYHQYVIRTGARQQIMDAFDENNIGYSIYYPVSLHEQECFEDLGYEASDCPVAKCASDTTLALPIYPELTKDQQAYVVDTVKKATSNL